MKKIFLITVVFTFSVVAHPGPEQKLHHENDSQVRMISQKIKVKATSSLLTLRAKMYWDAGRQDEAIHDLEHALKLDSTYRPAITLLKKIK